MKTIKWISALLALSLVGLAGAETLKVTSIATCPTGCYYSWFSSGDQIAVITLNKTGVSGMEVRGRDGTKIKAGVEDTNLTWIASNRAYFASDKAVYTLDVTGKFKRLALPAPYAVAGTERVGSKYYSLPVRPMISPDGKWIVVSKGASEIGLLSWDFKTYYMLAQGNRIRIKDNKFEGYIDWIDDNLRLLLISDDNKNSFYFSIKINPISIVKKMIPYREDLLAFSRNDLAIFEAPKEPTPVIKCEIDYTNCKNLFMTDKLVSRVARLSKSEIYFATVNDPDYPANRADYEYGSRFADTGEHYPYKPIIIRTDGAWTGAVKSLPNEVGGLVYWSPKRDEFLITTSPNYDSDSTPEYLYTIEVVK